YPALGMVCLTLLRKYGTLFLYPTTIHPPLLSGNLGISSEKLEQYLVELQQMGIIQYRKNGSGTRIYMQHERVNSEYLIINMQKIIFLRERQQERTRQLIRFLTNEKECREKMLLRYFGAPEKNDC